MTLAISSGWGRAALLFGALIVAGLSGCYGLSKDVYVCGNACAPKVELIRGTTGIFPGEEDFQQVLADRGVASTVTYCEAWRSIADRIAEERECGSCQPIVLFGYSKGAPAAIWVARDLAERGIAVDAIIILEGFHREKIPGNVRYCFNAFLPGWVPRLRGLPVEPECEGTLVVNYDLAAHDCTGRMKTQHHLGLPCDPGVQALLADQIATVLNRGCCPY
jgi:hypothetical protein